MARGEKTRFCLDADVVVAGLFSRGGASHAILVLGEIGLIELVLPEAAVAEIRRTLEEKMPEALAYFDEFLRAVAIDIYQPTSSWGRRARALADEKDIPIMAAALGSGAAMLITHNTRHFRSTERLRVIRPGDFMERARAWMASFGSEGA